MSGQKIILPENVKRTDTKLCEQVDIPIPIIDPLTVGNNRVLISTLDEVSIKSATIEFNLPIPHYYMYILQTISDRPNGFQRRGIVEQNSEYSLRRRVSHQRKFTDLRADRRWKDQCRAAHRGAPDQIAHRQWRFKDQ